jgi:hypothetical protein
MKIAKDHEVGSSSPTTDEDAEVAEEDRQLPLELSAMSFTSTSTESGTTSTSADLSAASQCGGGISPATPAMRG